MFTKPMMVVDEEFAALADCQLFGTKKSQNELFGVPSVTMLVIFGLTVLNLIIAGSTLGYWAQRRFRRSFRVKY